MALPLGVIPRLRCFCVPQKRCRRLASSSQGCRLEGVASSEAQAARPANPASDCGRRSTQRWPAARSEKSLDAKQRLAAVTKACWPQAAPRPPDSSLCWRSLATASSKTENGPLDRGRTLPPSTPLRTVWRRDLFRSPPHRNLGKALLARAHTTSAAGPGNFQCFASCEMNCCLWNRSWRGRATSPTVPSMRHNPCCQSCQLSNCRRRCPETRSPVLGPRACRTLETWGYPPARADRKHGMAPRGKPLQRRTRIQHAWGVGAATSHGQ